MTIDEFAREVHVSARNVRAYIERGLLPPPRIVDRRSVFDSGHVQRMLAIQRLQREGFSLQGIATLLDAWQEGSSLDDLVGFDRPPPAAGVARPDAASLFPATKFVPPPARREHVARRRCLELAARSGAQHVLITAPAGGGKSILAGQLLAAHPGPTAWMSVEPADGEPGRFWTALLVALRDAFPPAADLLSGLSGGGDVDRCLVDLAASLAAERPGLAVVIDDLHEIGDHDVMRQLEWLIDRVDARDGRLVVCSRTAPDLALGRLMMRGQLNRLTAQELSLDGDEARELIAGRLGVDIDADDVERVRANLDGWASGLYLAGLALRAGTGPEELSSAVRDGEPSFQGLLAGELLRSFDAAQLAFLEDIAILDRFTPDLCDAVRGSDDSRVILDGLQRASLFVIPLGAEGGWLRLHHTLTGALRARGATADARPRLLRAGRWYESEGHAAEAIDFYLRAEEHDAAAALVAAVYPHFMNVSHRGSAVAGWLDRLPADTVDRSPGLLMAGVGVAGLRGEQEEMANRLGALQALPADLVLDDGGTVASNGQLMRAVFHFGALGRALDAARAALATSPPGAQWLPMLNAAYALLAYWVDGPTDDVLRAADDVIGTDAGRQQPIAVVGAHALRGAVLAERGDEHGARAAIESARRRRGSLRIERVPQAANTWTSTSRALLLVGDVDGAVADAETGYRSVADVPADRDATGAVVPALIALAHALRMQGRDAEARAYATEAAERLEAQPDCGRLPALLAAAI